MVKHKLWGQSEGDDSSSFYLDASGLGEGQLEETKRPISIFENQLERFPARAFYGF